MIEFDFEYYKSIVALPKMNRATEIVLDWAVAIEDGFGHNDEIYIYSGDHIYNDILEWCEENTDAYDMDAFSIVMTEANETVDYDLIASIITEYKKEQTLGIQAGRYMVYG
jgi:hypothetical protein